MTLVPLAKTMLLRPGWRDWASPSAHIWRSSLFQRDIPLPFLSSVGSDQVLGDRCSWLASSCGPTARERWHFGISGDNWEFITHYYTFCAFWPGFGWCARCCKASCVYFLWHCKVAACIFWGGSGI